MADKKEMTPKTFEKQIPNNVISLSASKCCAEDCKKKPEKANFCAEHFDWFKAGLITREGMKASDFDKKFYHYSASAKKAA